VTNDGPTMADRRSRRLGDGTHDEHRGRNERDDED
jgi:hypothetical protein